MSRSVVIHTDGGSRGNPGPGAGAFVLKDADGKLLAARGVFLPNITNNYAEYIGMIEGLKSAVELKAQAVEVFTDSELMTRQINGQYKVKSPNLKDLYAECMGLLSNFKSWKVTHVYRSDNTEADSLANKAMDAKKDVVKKCTANPENVQPPIRLGVLLSGGGTTMLNLQKEIDAGSLNAQIVEVISSLSTVRGVELAKGMGLEPKIVRRKDFDSIELFSKAIEKIMDDAKVDLIVQAGWLCLWQIPKQYEYKVMNIHPALLPGFGGKGMFGHHVHEAVLKKGCKISGCTVHFATNEYDAGPIIIQRTCEVLDDDDVDTLAARVFQQECIAYPKAIKLFQQKKLKVTNGIVKTK